MPRVGAEAHDVVDMHEELGERELGGGALVMTAEPGIWAGRNAPLYPRVTRQLGFLAPGASTTAKSAQQKELGRPAGQQALVIKVGRKRKRQAGGGAAGGQDGRA